jgi:hypothetical protein
MLGTLEKQHKDKTQFSWELEVTLQGNAWGITKETNYMYLEISHPTSGK